MSWIALFIATLNFIAISNGQSSGLDFNLYICTSPGNCTPEATTLVADYYYSCSDQVSCDQVTLTLQFKFHFCTSLFTNKRFYRQRSTLKNWG